MTVLVDVELGEVWRATFIANEESERTLLSIDDADSSGGVALTLSLTTREMFSLASWVCGERHASLSECRVFRTITAVIESADDPEYRCLRPRDVLALAGAARAVLVARQHVTQPHEETS